MRSDSFEGSAAGISSAVSRKSILYVDSDEEFRKNFASRFSPGSYEVFVTSSISETLEKALLELPSAIVVDPNFPDLEGIKLLRALRKISPGSIFILHSRLNEMDPSLRSLDWIYASFEKSNQTSLLVGTVCRAIEEKNVSLNDFHRKALQEENLISEISWLQWKENNRNSEQLSIGKNILDNLTHSISQGLGIGSLITRLDMVEAIAKKKEGHYEIPVELMDSILENKNILRDWTEKLEKFRSLFDLNVAKERTHFDLVQSSILDSMAELGEIARIKNQKIIYEERLFNSYVFSSPAFLKFACKELLVNAMKFSPSGSRIPILFYSTNKYVCLTILNDIEFAYNGICGIPEEYYFKVFEPFFRLNHVYDERFNAHDFGFGIGLNLAQNLARQSDCKVSVYELTDYTEDVPTRKVAAEIQFPLC
ncbi:response regulator [Leptospira fluminis]|uniref:Response regulator n=1 Tax=Leptospira fluminis TaxID=2484979 RepID=A0A4R9GRF0_9LEPT|nr:response regulator [Leptospira fluminis]